MRVRRLKSFAGRSGIGAFVLMCTCPSFALAQSDHSHSQSVAQADGLIKVVRDATERFMDVTVAQNEGYALMFGCVSGPDAGAMGLHFVKGDLLGDGELDPAKPEIVIYEALPDGSLKLIGADYLVFADAWHRKHGIDAPVLMGQLLHLFEKPNRFAQEPFYTLHVWAWKENPNGAFVNWHPNVTCKNFKN